MRLILEVTRVILETDPDTAYQQTQQCLDKLNASIRDVRGYIEWPSGKIAEK